jgi:hypothetical protein
MPLAKPIKELERPLTEGIRASDHINQRVGLAAYNNSSPLFQYTPGKGEARTKIFPVK